MIDIKTLTIGSHVLVGGKRVCVDEIRTLRIDEPIRLSVSHNGLFYDRPSIDDVEPISITPELLTEIGFKYHEYDNGKLWEWDLPDGYKDYGYLEFDEETTTIWRGRLWSMKEIEVEFNVEYLHDLENIFYMFYGVELIKE